MRLFLCHGISVTASIDLLAASKASGIVKHCQGTAQEILGQQSQSGSALMGFDIAKQVHRWCHNMFWPLQETKTLPE
jgi:hypothetical protein